MNCCNIETPNIVGKECHNDFQFNEFHIELKGNERKIFKLLLKQYEIDSISRNQPEFFDEKIIYNQPLIVKYFDRQKPKTIFEWKIKSFNLY